VLKTLIEENGLIETAQVKENRLKLTISDNLDKRTVNGRALCHLIVGSAKINIIDDK
jgi:hypothetical protein